jgi:hypothetical protein
MAGTTGGKQPATGTGESMDEGEGTQTDTPV